MESDNEKELNWRFYHEKETNKIYGYVIVFGVINPILVAFDRHGVIVTLVGVVAWIGFLFSVAMYALTKDYTEDELILAVKSKFEIE